MKNDKMTDVLASIEGINRRLGRHKLLQSLQPGVSAEHVRSLLGEASLPSTPELEVLYAWHNGVAESDTGPIGEISLWPGFYFMPIEEAVLNYKTFISDPRWKTGWLPVFADGGGDFYIVDLSEPGDSPVRDFRIDFGECIIEFNSLSDMMKTIEQAFERGVFYRESKTEEYLEMDDNAFDKIALELNPDVEWWQRE